MKRSILFLTNAYPDFDSSYRGIFIKKMATLLQGEGYEISVVTPKIYNGSQYFEDQNGIKVYRFPFLSGNKLLIEYNKIPYLRMVLYYISGFLFAVYVLLKNKCDLIHAHWAIPTGLIGVLVGGLLRKTLIVTIHGSDFRMAMTHSHLLKKLFLFVCKKATHLNCVSPLMKRELENVGIEKGKMTTFPMGINETFLQVGKTRREKADLHPPTVLSNRNFLPIYNVSLLIRAIPAVLQKVPQVRFLVAGDGPLRKNLEKEVKNLNVSSSVQFLGRVPHDKMPNLLAETDIYVSTSTNDGTSVSLLEAMAAGAFPIVTGIASNVEWIKDGKNGFLVPIDGETLLAKKIVEAIGDKAFLEKSRYENLSIIEESALWSVIIERMKNIYDETFRDRKKNELK